ncbi:carboxymuconolactone decarboxylase family protein [Nocardia otitidiscaviarum]|uniref:carboxymuconolactone decarboxylase family protein n=1 Tax=Nocardia otitidiscaviarum TaxID=1823 RepID=UPI0004A70793|nr:carboxymuconolactone decarboxylase family protein [Nocardia otitidiscaviarum]MBF6132772.1 carboxymuconolactone decarboxylase family protein [Nocardia otitidiscaviarum]MBF6486191.1 carboxymuconolactone decarboxylase family protein [Nocardia otitidiscaviarum]
MSRLNLPKLAPEVYQAWAAAEMAIQRGPLDPVVRELVKIRVSQINGCLFCIDMHTTQARKEGESEQRIFHLNAWRESTLFTDTEQAALDYAEAATALGPHGVSDEIWAAVEKHFDEGQRGGLVAITAQINLWNRLGVPLRLQPGGY